MNYMSIKIYIMSVSINTNVNSKLISKKYVSVILKLLKNNYSVNTKITQVNDSFSLYRNIKVFNSLINILLFIT